MLFNKLKKTSIQDFDFTKKISKKTNKKTFAAVGSILSTFFLFQIGILSYDIFLLESKFKKQEHEVYSVFEINNSLTEDLKKGNQEGIINNFIKIKTSPFAITDLLSSMTITRIYNNETIEDKDKNEDSINVTPETKKTLVSIYNSNINSGLKKELNDKIDCFFADLSCYILKPIIEPKMKAQLKSIQEQLDIKNYHISHSEEYKEWYKKTTAILAKDPHVIQDLRTPGEIYFANNKSK